MISKPELDILTPRIPGLPDNVRAFMTLRAGGVSSGPFGDASGIGGMNVGAYVEDFEACVRTNRAMVADFAGARPLWLKQVHGTGVVFAEEAQNECVADAAIATTPGVACVVQTADCLPILLARKDGRAVAAVHASWTCLAKGVVGATFAKLSERFEGGEYLAWIGPHIRLEDFEIGEDVLEFFEDRGRDVRGYAKIEGPVMKLDLTAIAVDQLREAGLAPGDIHDARLSTYADSDRFFSYRRDGKTGRHATLIWMTK